MRRTSFSSFILHPLLAVTLVAAFPCFAQIDFDFADWTSFRDTRGARSIDAGAHEIFFATSGGILSFHLTRREWFDPMVMGYGLLEAVEIGDPVLLFLDTETRMLWVANETELLIFDFKVERWKRTARNLWAPGDRVINIGAGGSHVYVETIPGSDYQRYVASRPPLPDPRWELNVTRYKGSRQLGGFFLDLDDQEPQDVRWRGLRTLVPLEDSDLAGLALGRPPAGLPLLSTPHGWVWHTDGTLQDAAMRPNPITDWYIDRWGRFWSTHWGAGILMADLHTGVGELFMQGPAGNDIRAILVSDRETWMGGFNNGDRMGFSRADPTLRQWSFVERRDDSRILTTNLYDLAEWDNRTWFATAEGLLALDKKGKWQRFKVQDGLYHERVTALAAAGDQLWIGTEDGLNVLSRVTRTIDRVPQEGLQTFGVTDVALCGDTVCVGSSVGLFRGSRVTQSFGFASLDPGLLAAEVREISVIGDEIWLVTPEGVMRYNQRTGASKSWYARDWLGGAEPSCICATDRFVWVGTTSSGFYRHNPKTGEWLDYTMKDGLVSNRVQIIRRDGDDLLIGTDSGLTRFYWNRPRQNR